MHILENIFINNAICFTLQLFGSYICLLKYKLKENREKLELFIQIIFYKFFLLFFVAVSADRDYERKKTSTLFTLFDPWQSNTETIHHVRWYIHIIS